MLTTAKLQQLYWDWQFDASSWLHHQALRLIVILTVAWLLLRAIRLLRKRLERLSEREDLPQGVRAQQLHTLASVTGSVGKFLVYFVALLEILPLLGIDVRPLLASAGIAGVIIGFGAQTLVKDMINGFLILLEHQYDIGDTVKLAGVQGVVEAISLRRTALRDGNGALHIVPNSEARVVSNFTRDWSRVTVSVLSEPYQDTEKIMTLLREVNTELAAESAYIPLLLAPPEVLGVDRFSNTEAEYAIGLKVRPGSQDNITRELRRRIKERFDRSGIKYGGPDRTYAPEVPESSPSNTTRTKGSN